jgi:hypothetical protein
LKATEKDKAKLNQIIVQRIERFIIITIFHHTKSKVDNSNGDSNEENYIITLTEKIKLKKDQYEVLKMICDTYQTSFSQYIGEAIIEAMRFDVEEGNLCDTLLEKIDNEDRSKNKNNSVSSSPGSLASDLMKSDVDLLKKLQTQI